MTEPSESESVIESEDLAFDEAVERTLKAFGEEVKQQKENRRGEVMSRLDEEIARLRPQAHRLLYGK